MMKIIRRVEAALFKPGSINRLTILHAYISDCVCKLRASYMKYLTAPWINDATVPVALTYPEPKSTCSSTRYGRSAVAPAYSRQDTPCNDASGFGLLG